MEAIIELGVYMKAIIQLAKLAAYIDSKPNKSWPRRIGQKVKRKPLLDSFTNKAVATVK